MDRGATAIDALVGVTPEARRPELAATAVQALLDGKDPDRSQAAEVIVELMPLSRFLIEVIVNTVGPPQYHLTFDPDRGLTVAR